MTSTIKVNNIQNQCGQNIINENSNTITLGASGDTIALASGASQTGFGRTGTVDWQTGSIKTSTFTAANGEGYFANTSGGAFTMNLPAGTAGNIVSVVDYTNTFQTNNLTIAPNGSQKIGGVAASISLSTEGQSVTLIYVDDTEGWKNVQDSTSNVIGNPNLVATGGTITTSGDYKIHKFTGPGTFTVSSVSQTPANNTVSYLVVAGGGGGGATVGACQVGNAGGGAGGFREYRAPVSGCYTASPLNGNPGGTAITVTAQAYPITVGAGGTSPNSSPLDGGDGSPSVFSSITSTGGGGGADEATKNGSPGGSGGGAAYIGTVGNGNTPPVSPAQGTNGGLAQYSAGPTAVAAAGGGGGATAVGAAATPSAAGAGGAGATTSITASPVAYAGGGGGGTFNNNGTVGAGGTGGGAAGVKNSAGAAVNGTTNTGGGGGGTGGKAGGGGNSFAGGAGGSGIVIIRYKFQ